VIEGCSLSINYGFSVGFELGSTLVRIADRAFTHTKLSSFEIPPSVCILGSSCFSRCQMLTQVTFEMNSILKEMHSRQIQDYSELKKWLSLQPLP
jgi:hypothetical protein